MCKKFYYVIVVKAYAEFNMEKADVMDCGLDKFRKAVAVEVDFGLDLMDAFSKYINAGDDIEKVYPVQDMATAKDVAEKYNKLDKKTLQDVEEMIMDKDMKEVYQELTYEREDTEQENYRIARMDKEKRDAIEKATDDMKARLQEYHDLMRRMLGDGAYTQNISQVQHHFGQIDIDLFDALAGLME